MVKHASLTVSRRSPPESRHVLACPVEARHLQSPAKSFFLNRSLPLSFAAADADQETRQHEGVLLRLEGIVKVGRLPSWLMAGASCQACTASSAAATSPVMALACALSNRSEP